MRKTSIVERPSRVRPVWFVTRPTRLPFRQSKPRSISTSIPHFTAGTVEASTMASATIVETSAREAIDGNPLVHRMEPAGEQDHDGSRLRINPETRAGEARMAEAARAEAPLGAVVRGVDVPAEPAFLTGGGRAGIEHQANGLRLQDARAVRRDAAVEKHLSKDREVIGRAEQPGVAGDAAERPGPGIVNHAAQPARRFVPLGRRDVGRRGQRAGKDRPEHRGMHPQRLEERRAREGVERLPADPLDEPAEDHEADVAVDEPLARLSGEVEIGEPLPGGFGAILVIGQAVIGHQTRPVPQELLDRDRALAVIVKLGHVLSKSIIKTEPAPLDEDHDGRGRRQRLGQRGHVEHGVAGHRLDFRLNGPIAERLDVSDLAASQDENDRPRHLLGGDGPRDGRIDLFQARGQNPPGKGKPRASPPV